MEKFSEFILQKDMLTCPHCNRTSPFSAGRDPNILIIVLIFTMVFTGLLFTLVHYGTYGLKHTHLISRDDFQRFPLDSSFEENLEKISLMPGIDTRVEEVHYSDESEKTDFLEVSLSDKAGNQIRLSFDKGILKSRHFTYSIKNQLAIDALKSAIRKLIRQN